MISVTALSDYLYCARKLYIQSVLGIRELPKEVLVLGAIRHETHDRINKAEESIVKGIKKYTSIDFLRQIYVREHSKILREVVMGNKKNLSQFNLSFLDVFKKHWPSILEESENRAHNTFRFIEKNNLYGDELWENIFPKIQSEIRIESRALQLKGIVDQIEIYKEGYVPVELKTGKCPKDGVWPGHRVQIGAYAMLIEDVLKKEVKEGFVSYVDSKERRHIAINPFLKDEILEIRDIVIALKSQKEVPDVCGNENKCSACGLASVCSSKEALSERLKLVA